MQAGLLMESLLVCKSIRLGINTSADLESLENSYGLGIILLQD